ncbi:MAG: hypothetical protein IRZ13_09845 [Acetobacteraceae bacterium]|jgi:hypothetical protein|nr:hypothetical protein [Acetobacteraceae bacterium]
MQTFAMLALAGMMAPGVPAMTEPSLAAEPVPVQYYYDRGPYAWQRHEYRRERRRAREQARINEAARREAWRIERERQARRTARQAWRQQQYGYGYGYRAPQGYYRSW